MTRKRGKRAVRYRIRAAINVLRGRPTVYGLIHAEIHLSDAATVANWGLLCSSCTALHVYAAGGSPYDVDGERHYIPDGEEDEDE